MPTLNIYNFQNDIPEWALSSPLKWIENQSPTNQFKWIKHVIYTENPFPAKITKDTHLDIFLVNLFSKCSGELFSNLSAMINDLLGEFNTNIYYRFPHVFEYLLNLCGHFRFKECEDTIVDIIMNRLKYLTNSKDEIILKEHCLTTLSGLGCISKETIGLFEEYLLQIDYSKICYVALYTKNPLFAAKKLPLLLKLHKEYNRLEILEDNIIVAFYIDIKEPVRLKKVIIEILHLDDKQFLNYEILPFLEKIGITFDPIPKLEDIDDDIMEDKIAINRKNRITNVDEEIGKINLNHFLVHDIRLRDTFNYIRINNYKKSHEAMSKYKEHLIMSGN